MMNDAVYAMKILQTAMKGEAEKAGLASDEDISAMVAEMRTGDNGLEQINIDPERL